jgi:hypothetical protein
VAEERAVVESGVVRAVIEEVGVEGGPVAGGRAVRAPPQP